MAGATRQGTREPGEAGPLTEAEVVDTADTAARTPAPDTSGKRVRAIPGAGGTTVVLDSRDFKANGISHKGVTWDYRKDNFTVKVGTGDNQLSEEAADFLTKNFPGQFEYLENS